MGCARRNASLWDGCIPLLGCPELPCSTVAEPHSVCESPLLWLQANNWGLKLQAGGTPVQHSTREASIPISSLGNQFSQENSPCTSPRHSRGAHMHTKLFIFRVRLFHIENKTDYFDTKMLFPKSFLVTWHTFIFESMTTFQVYLLSQRWEVQVRMCHLAFSQKYVHRGFLCPPFCPSPSVVLQVLFWSQPHTCKS